MLSPLLADLVLRMAELPGLMAALVVLWLLIIGGSVGSFLNVVIYRLPAGLSLVHPSSRCPKCGTPIWFRDNIPVLGWLLLGGKCRACRASISPRYPLVEATIALIFLALAWCEPLSAGINLPVPPALAGKLPLWGMLPYHFTLACGVVAAGLMMFDGEAVPRKFWLFVWLVGFAAGAAWPMLRPIGVAQLIGAVQHIGAVQLDPKWSPYVFSLVEGMAGTLLGIALGAASWPAATAVGNGRSGNLAGPALLAIVGVYLGWQAAAGVSVIAATLWATWQVVRFAARFRADFGWALAVAAATVAWLFAWREIVSARPQFGNHAPWYLAPAAVGLTFVVSLSGRTLADAVRRRAVSPAASAGR